MRYIFWGSCKDVVLLTWIKINKLYEDGVAHHWGKSHKEEFRLHGLLSKINIYLKSTVLKQMISQSIRLKNKYIKQVTLQSLYCQVCSSPFYHRRATPAVSSPSGDVVQEHCLYIKYVHIIYTHTSAETVTKQLNFYFIYIIMCWLPMLVWHHFLSAWITSWFVFSTVG